MTAEIGILNRIGVALAADSAVTIGAKNTQKVFNTANKLFALTKYHPVGIMIYGGADFMGTPWETVVKMYRTQLDGKKFDSLKDYADDFIRFVDNTDAFSAPDAERMFIQSCFYSHLENIAEDAARMLHKQSNDATEEQALDALKSTIEQYLERINAFEFLDGFDRDYVIEFSSHYTDAIQEVIEELIRFPIDESTLDSLAIYAALIFARDAFITNPTGIVISGFGEQEIFPSLYQFIIEGKPLGKLRYKLEQQTVISAANGQSTTTAAIKPFAQQEMVHSFLSGMDPTLKHETISVLSDLFSALTEEVSKSLIESRNLNPLTPEEQSHNSELSRSILNDFRDALEHVQREYFAKPFIDIVGNLPKEELAAMAETLVNLTSFKRRMTIDTETVGGPIDVAVITKGDGFVWIKRKHYFSPELNHHFFNKN